MKKIISSLTLLAFLTIPIQAALAWHYDGINSLNPFTGFRNCNKCEKIKKHKCHKVKRNKCNSCANIMRTNTRTTNAFYKDYIYP